MWISSYSAYCFFHSVWFLRFIHSFMCIHGSFLFLLLSTIPFCKCTMVYLTSCFMVTWVRKHVIFSETDKLAKQSSSYGFVFVKNVDTQKNTCIYTYTHICHKDISQEIYISIYHSMDLWDYVVGYIYITTLNIFL